MHTTHRFLIQNLLVVLLASAHGVTASAQEIVQWKLDGTLEAVGGGSPIELGFAAPAVEPGVAFETVDIRGEPALAARFTRGTYLHLHPGLTFDSNGKYVNQYTVIFDVRFDEESVKAAGKAALCQTNTNNANDAEVFVRGNDGAIMDPERQGSRFVPWEWNRVMISANLPAGTVWIYVNGALADTINNQWTDGRYSLFTVKDGGLEGLLLFADENGENASGHVSSIAIHHRALFANEAAAYGGPSASGIPAAAPCPQGFRGQLNPSDGSVTLSWKAGHPLPGPGLVMKRDAQPIASLPFESESYVDVGAPPGLHRYELALAEGSFSCGEGLLWCVVDVTGSSFLFDDFNAYATLDDLARAGWEVRDVNNPMERSSWGFDKSLYANPPGADGQPTSGKYLVSTRDFAQPFSLNVVGSGMAYDLLSPAFSTMGSEKVWLHFDTSTQLNGVDGSAVFEIAVLTRGGDRQETVFRRVSPGRAVEPKPIFAQNVDGLHGRVHVDISAQAANEQQVRVRFRHLEPVQDYWVAIDNVLVDSVPPPGGQNVLLAEESFGEGIPADWRALPGPTQTLSDAAWSTGDTCNLSMLHSGFDFPGGFQGIGIHNLDEAFALHAPLCHQGHFDSMLVTPAIDCSLQEHVVLSLKSAIVVVFESAADILVSLDGGVTFLDRPIFAYTTRALHSSAAPVFQELRIEVPEAAGQPNVALAFRHRSTGGYSPAPWWAIDDVLVTGDGPTSPIGTIFHRGDVDTDGVVAITDAVKLLGYLFLGEIEPGCLEAADADDDGQIQLTDAIRVLGYLFLGSEPPALPGPSDLPCGPDAVGSPVFLGCSEYSGCRA